MRAFYQVPNSAARLQLTSQLPAYQRPGDFDFCMADEALLMAAMIGAGGLEQICCPQGRRPYAQRPWITMPAEGRRFRPISTLNLPAGPPLGVLNIVPFPGTVSGYFEVPIGYDGIITDVVCEIVAPGNAPTGFTEGSGDVLWRLSANGRYIRDLGNITTTLGSLIAPSPVPRGGNRIYSGDQVVFAVEFANNAVANLNPSDRIVCSISGWIYPR